MDDVVLLLPIFHPLAGVSTRNVVFENPICTGWPAEFKNRVLWMKR